MKLGVMFSMEFMFESYLKRLREGEEIDSVLFEYFTYVLLPTVTVENWFDIASTCTLQYLNQGSHKQKIQCCHL
jgi:hypothetical protein